MRISATLVIAAKVALSAALVALVLSKVDLDTVLRVLREADPWFVLMFYLLSPITITLSAWRWEVLAPEVSLWTAFKYTWIGVFFGHVLPGGISGDVAKGVSLALKDASSREGLAASIVADKLIGLGALLLFFDVACAIVYLMQGGAEPALARLAFLGFVLTLVAVVAGIAGIVIASRLDPALHERFGVVGRIVGAVGSAARYYAGKPSMLAKAFALSMAIHVLNIAGTYLSFRALHIDAAPLFAAIVYPILSIVLLVPVSVSGIGVRDATLAVLFATFGLPPASGVALSWLALLIVIPNIVIGASVQLFEMYRKH